MKDKVKITEMTGVHKLVLSFSFCHLHNIKNTLNAYSFFLVALMTLLMDNF